MAQQYKSVNKALKKGHLKIAYRKAFSGRYDPQSGIPLYNDIPYLERKTNTGRWIFYSNI